jgi:ribulose-phosphate 3-epimerase
MDGHFVPNITVGPAVVKALRPHVSIPLDVHLMIAPVDPYLEAFRDAGADHILVHPEAGPHLDRTVGRIRELGAKAGVVFDPSTAPDVIEWMIDQIDIILVMTVNPGFGGQSFLSSQLGKITRLRGMIDASGRDIVLEVDGGVNPQTGRRCVEAGADALVAGTAVFKDGPAGYAANIAALRGA